MTQEHDDNMARMAKNRNLQLDAQTILGMVLTALVALLAWNATRIVGQVDTLNEEVVTNLTRISVVETHISQLREDVTHVRKTLERFVVPAISTPGALQRVEDQPPEVKEKVEEVLEKDD